MVAHVDSDGGGSLFVGIENCGGDQRSRRRMVRRRRYGGGWMPSTSFEVLVFSQMVKEVERFLLKKLRGFC